MTVRFHPGLSAEFVLCVDEAIERVQRSPATYPKVHEAARRVVVRRFPFARFSEIADSEIRVLAIFHSRRNPSHWRSRKSSPRT